MKAAMHHHPLAAKAFACLDMAKQIAVDPIAHMRRDLGHIDGGERVDAYVDAVVVTRLPDGGDPLIGQRLNGVGWDIDLEIEIANAVLDRRLDPVLLMPCYQTDGAAARLATARHP